MQSVQWAVDNYISNAKWLLETLQQISPSPSCSLRLGSIKYNFNAAAVKARERYLDYDVTSHPEYILH